MRTTDKLSTDNKLICNLLYIRTVYIKYLLHNFVVLPVLIKHFNFFKSVFHNNEITGYGKVWHYNNNKDQKILI